MPFFLENYEPSVKKFINVIIIKLECSKSRKIPIIFLPFLNLKNIIQSYIIFKKILVCLFCGLDPCPQNFLAVHLLGGIQLNI